MLAPKFAMLTKGSKLPLNQGSQNRFLVTTVSCQAIQTLSADAFENILPHERAIIPLVLHVLILCNFSFCHNVFKTFNKFSAAEASESVFYVEKG